MISQTRVPRLRIISAPLQRLPGHIHRLSHFRKCDSNPKAYEHGMHQHALPSHIPLPSQPSFPAASADSHTFESVRTIPVHPNTACTRWLGPDSSENEEAARALGAATNRQAITPKQRESGHLPNCRHRHRIGLAMRRHRQEPDWSQELFAVIADVHRESAAETGSPESLVSASSPPPPAPFPATSIDSHTFESVRAIPAPRARHLKSKGVARMALT